MIRNVQDAGRLLDQHCGGAGRGPWSVLRILAWVVIGLFLIGRVVPMSDPPLSANKYNKRLKDPLARIVTLDKNDPRGFTRTRDPKDTFTIAWVGPSTLQSISPKRYAFIPADVRARVPEIDGRPVKVDIYFMSGARVVDWYASVQAALNSDADMIMVDANPLWLFNERAVQAWEAFNGVTFADIWDKPSQWGMATLYSPSDAVLGMVGRKVPAVRNRWSYSEELRDRVSVLQLLDTRKRPAADPRPSELDLVARMQEPIEFWTRYRSQISASASIRARQVAFLQQSDVSPGTVSGFVVDRTLASLAQSRVPVYMYVPALDPEAMKDPAISRTLTGIERRLGEIAARHRSPLLEVRSESLGRTLPPMRFNDLAHLQDDGPMVTFLAEQLCRQALSTGIATRCTPRPEGNP